LIEHASRLTEPAQHALLKLLEEPPPNTHVVLVGGDDRLLLPTIRSRCATLRLGLPEPASAVALLVARLAIPATVATSLLALTGGRPGPHLRGRTAGATTVSAASLRATLLALTYLLHHRRVGAAAALTTAVGQLLPGDRATGLPQERRAAVTTVFDCARLLVSDLARISAGAPTAVSQTETLELLVPIAAAATQAEWSALLARVGAAQRALHTSVNPELLLDTLALSWPYDAPLS
jgi:DNA polymerase-3 subunit delta'